MIMPSNPTVNKEYTNCIEEKLTTAIEELGIPYNTIIGNEPDTLVQRIWNYALTENTMDNPHLNIRKLAHLTVEIVEHLPDTTAIPNEQLALNIMTRLVYIKELGGIAKNPNYKPERVSKMLQPINQRNTSLFSTNGYEFELILPKKNRKIQLDQASANLLYVYGKRIEKGTDNELLNELKINGMSFFPLKNLICKGLLVPITNKWNQITGFDIPEIKELEKTTLLATLVENNNLKNLFKKHGIDTVESLLMLTSCKFQNGDILLSEIKGIGPNKIQEIKAFIKNSNKIQEIKNRIKNNQE